MFDTSLHSSSSVDSATLAQPASVVRAPRASAVATIDSARLLAGGRELLIRHGTEEYRLRLTRNDKLILTK